MKFSLNHITFLTVFILATTSCDLTSGGNEVGAVQSIKVSGNLKYTVANKLATLTDYTGSSKTIDIPSTIDGITVTSIGAKAFENKGLTSITIPNSITSIGNYAFNNNVLTSLELPQNLSTVGNYAFANNTLASLTIGKSVTSIGNYAFNNNVLTSIEIPDSLSTIGDYAFANNTLTSLTIGTSLTSIGAYAFSTNILSTLEIPDSLTTIGSHAFTSNKLTTVIIGTGITSIGSQAFSLQQESSNNKLAEVTIKASKAPSLGGTVFYNALTLTSTLYIPVGATNYSGNQWDSGSPKFNAIVMR